MSIHLIQADGRALPLPANSVDCVVTSPPYFSVRDYGTGKWEGGNVGCDHRMQRAGVRNQGRDRCASGGTFHDSPKIKEGLQLAYRNRCGNCGALRVDSQIGLELEPSAYVEEIARAFDEVWRVLRPSGTLWVVLGDTYAGSWGVYQPLNLPGECGQRKVHAEKYERRESPNEKARCPATAGMKEVKAKNLIGIPWRVAFALQARGWFLRSEIIWAKRNPMPESVKDRPVRCHETIFLLAKSKRYYYDLEPVKQPVTGNAHCRGSGVNPKAMKWPSGNCGSKGRYRSRQNQQFSAAMKGLVESRNCRSVWTTVTQGYSGDHYATFPEKLIEPCILAGCPLGGIVLDPFCGTGTTLRAAWKLGREAIGIDLSFEYLLLSRARCQKIQRRLPL